MENPSFHLEGIVREKDSMQDFEGPLSLILMLLQKNKIEIRDLRVSDILDQYLAYLDQMQSMDLEIASEFVQMASQLLYLKTRTLLTTEEEVSELEVLMQSLEELQAKERFADLQRVIPALKQGTDRGMLSFTKEAEVLDTRQQEYPYSIETVDLLKAMLAIRVRDDQHAPAVEERLVSAIPKRISYSVRDKGREILLSLRDAPKSLSSFYARCVSGSELVATFVAVLELCSSGSLHIDRVEEQIVLSFIGNPEEMDAALNVLEDE